MVWIFGILELIAAVYLGLQVYPMIPTIYFWILVGAEVLFVLLAALAVRRTWSAIVMSIFAIILIALLFIGNSVMKEVSDMVDKVTDNPTGEIIDMAVIVEKDDVAESISDIVGYRIGYLSEEVSEGTKGTIEKLDAELTGAVEYVEYQDIVSMINDLFAGEVDGLIINSAYLGILAEQDDYLDIYDRIKILNHYYIEGTLFIPDYTPDTSIDTEVDTDSTETETDSIVSGPIGSSGLDSGDKGGWHNYGPTGLLGHDGPSAIGDGTFVVYISGIDVGGNPNTRLNSDVNLLLAINTNTKTIQMIDTPRDYYIPLAHTKGNLDKLTHAGCHSINASVITMEMLYGIDVDYYVKVNIDGFAQIIDAMGGVDVYSEYEFFGVKKGYNHLNGKLALVFVRERKSFAAGVIQRGKHQMVLLTAMIQKLTTPEALANYPELLQAISGSFVTNFSSDEVYELVKRELENPGGWKIQTYTVTGTGSSDYCYTMPGIKTYVMIPNYDTVETAKQKIKAVLQ